MEIVESSYYAEISILVDGWPWNLSEFDFRRFFAPGSCPRALVPVADNEGMRIAAQASRPSENRRLVESDNRRRNHKKRGNKKKRAA